MAKERGGEMKIPMIFYKNDVQTEKNTFYFIQKCNNWVYLYRKKNGIRECFDLFDLGLISKQRRTYNRNI